MSKDVCFHCKRSLNKKFRVKYGENIYCGVCYGKLKKDENMKKEEKVSDNKKCFTCGQETSDVKFKDRNGNYHCRKCHNDDIRRTDAPKCTGKCECHNKKETPKSIEEMAKEHSELQMSKVMRDNVKNCAIEANYTKGGLLHFSIHLERSSQEEKGTSDVNIVLLPASSQLAIKEIMEIVFKYSLQEKELAKLAEVAALEVQKDFIQEKINELKGVK